MFRNRAVVTVLACGSVLAVLPALALGQSAPAAPSYQLIDLGYSLDITSLHWGGSPPGENPPMSPPAATKPGPCPSLGGSGPSSETAASGPLNLAVGWSPTAQGTVHAIVCAVLFSPFFKDLGVLYGGPNSYGVNISEYVENIVGYSETNLAPAPLAQGTTVALAFVSLGGGAIKALLSAMDSPHYSTQAYAVNDAGEAVGAGQMLFTSGQQVGQVGNRAMLWEPNGQVYNLQFYLVGHPGVTLVSANMIDCHGNIAAYGYAPTDDVGNPTALREYLLLRQNPIGSCSSNPPPQMVG